MAIMDPKQIENMKSLFILPLSLVEFFKKRINFINYIPA